MQRTLTTIAVSVGLLATTPAAAAQAGGGTGGPDEGPWLAFVVLFGGLALAILLIAAFGGGVGPRPVIGSLQRAEEPEGGTTDEHAASEPEEPTEAEGSEDEAADG